MWAGVLEWGGEEDDCHKEDGEDGGWRGIEVWRRKSDNVDICIPVTEVTRSNLLPLNASL